jgi:hypothetical protein
MAILPSLQSEPEQAAGLPEATHMWLIAAGAVQIERSDGV